MLDEEKVTATLYNLILNPNTREWERKLLEQTKEQLSGRTSIKQEIEKLEAELRPLAIRGNLTPDVMDFYAEITGEQEESLYDYSKHRLTDPVHQEKAIFAGGCFWCMVEPFETKQGIISVLSGYTGGVFEQPNYDQVSGGYTGHVEAVEILFDTRIISYPELLAIYWQVSDPTDAFGQFQDRGKQYRSIIFVENDKQRAEAEQSKKQLIQSKQFNQPIITEIREATTFWPAENYHQRFYLKQPKRYKKMKHAHQLYLFFKRKKSNR